ncbi:exopolygalacturonase-like [Olea europaea subsp. europaea]|uniref:Exopolygalacturonase-like n=1 Tax=Olea europaea subsp. europaea TaxID=158383 RepID=A0A8S0QD16_OLEEU|nr:exopolygalacturonase-like [Olea europaea subsp. europaea]
MALSSGFGIVLTFFFLFRVFEANDTALPPKFFNVLDYGAVADGKTDNSEAFLEAWKYACEYDGRSGVVVPLGTFMLGSVTFQGLCKGSMEFLIKGTLQAPTDSSKFFTDTWIGFQYLDDLTVEGGGSLDGQGSAAWGFNDCAENSKCSPLPATLRFNFVNNSRIQNVQSINSKNAHFNLFACNNMNISHVKVMAPANSPNTDGIHIGSSQKIQISQSTIGTGDDCIAMIAGSQNIDIFDVICGPGHGISVGSLGRDHENDYVQGLSIRNCTFTGTENGVRIKTWSPSLNSLASDMRFEDIFMQNASNPIIIDQDYCPRSPCTPEGHSISGVQIKNVTFKNIWGTSSSKIAVNLECSKRVPCQKIEFVDINLVHSGPDGPATSRCANVIDSSYAKQMPPGCV